MIRIDHCYAIYHYIFRISDFDTTNRMVQNATPNDPYILHFIQQQLRFHNSSRCQINRRIAWYSYLIVRQIFGTMHSRPEIHHSFLFFRVSLRFHRIGKKMEIMQAVAIKLHRQILRFVQRKRNYILILHILHFPGLRTDIDLMNHPIIFFHHHFYRTAHIKLYHRSILYPIHIYLHIILKQIFPVAPRHTDTNRIVIIMRHTGLQSFGISH